MAFVNIGVACEILQRFQIIEIRITEEALYNSQAYILSIRIYQDVTIRIILYLNFYVFCAGELVQEIKTEDDGR